MSALTVGPDIASPWEGLGLEIPRRYSDGAAQANRRASAGYALMQVPALCPVARMQKKGVARHRNGNLCDGRGFWRPLALLSPSFRRVPDNSLDDSHKGDSQGDTQRVRSGVGVFNAPPIPPRGGFLPLS